MTEVPPWAPREFYNPRYNPRNGWDRCNSGLWCLAFPRVGLGVNPVPGNAPTRISQKIGRISPHPDRDRFVADFCAKSVAPVKN